MSLTLFRFKDTILKLLMVMINVENNRQRINRVGLYPLSGLLFTAWQSTFLFFLQLSQQSQLTANHQENNLQQQRPFCPQFFPKTFLVDPDYNPVSHVHLEVVFLEEMSQRNPSHYLMLTPHQPMRSINPAVSSSIICFFEGLGVTFPFLLSFFCFLLVGGI